MCSIAAVKFPQHSPCVCLQAPILLQNWENNYMGSSEGKLTEWFKQRKKTFLLIYWQIEEKTKWELKKTEGKPIFIFTQRLTHLTRSKPLLSHLLLSFYDYWVASVQEAYCIWVTIQSRGSLTRQIGVLIWDVMQRKITQKL